MKKLCPKQFQLSLVAAVNAQHFCKRSTVSEVTHLENEEKSGLTEPEGALLQAYSLVLQGIIQLPPFCKALLYLLHIFQLLKCMK